MGMTILFLLQNIDCGYSLEQPRRGKTNNLHMQKQGSRTADQRLCFHYTDSTIPLKNPKF